MTMPENQLRDNLNILQSQNQQLQRQLQEYKQEAKTWKLGCEDLEEQIKGKQFKKENSD